MNPAFQIVATLRTLSLPRTSHDEEAEISLSPMTELTLTECATVVGGSDDQTPRGGW